MNLTSLIRQRADLWRGGEISPTARPGTATGFQVLDETLAGGGWPRGAVTEILSSGEGVGAMDLLLPALARLSGEGRWIVLVAPPLVPYAPAFAARGVEPSRILLVQPQEGRDGLWALEQALRSGTCSAVLGWPRKLNPAVLRRLQLAAEEGESSGFLFRPAGVEKESSPAALRLQVRSTAKGIELDILKRRGGWPVRGMWLETSFQESGPRAKVQGPGFSAPGPR
jgi:hypothetical protein